MQKLRQRYTRQVKMMMTMLQLQLDNKGNSDFPKDIVTVPGRVTVRSSPGFFLREAHRALADYYIALVESGTADPIAAWTREIQQIQEFSLGPVTIARGQVVKEIKPYPVITGPSPRKMMDEDERITCYGCSRHVNACTCFPVGPATDQADDDPRDFDQMAKDGEI